jgi:hypothetical protein
VAPILDFAASTRNIAQPMQGAAASPRTRVDKGGFLLATQRTGIALPPPHLPQRQQSLSVQWRATMGQRLPLIEPVPVEVSLVTALSHVEDIGFGGCLVFYRVERCYESGAKQNVIKHKIAVPRPGIDAGAELVRAYLASVATLRLVK